MSLLCITYVHSSFEIILKKKKLVALLLLSYRCVTNTINLLWLFLTVPWVGLQCVIVVFPGHTHLLSDVWANSVNPETRVLHCNVWLFRELHGCFTLYS